VSTGTRQLAASLIGSSRIMQDLAEEIAAVGRSDAKVLITGESGVGKELVARALQGGSVRARKPFIVVNCAGLPETLLESELFGHVKGSFTGAYRDKPGKLEIADTGTILLDEVGEMSLRMQGLLLRFLETGELQKVGADRSAARVDVRVITSTNRNLKEMVAHGQFREDLLYRLNVISITVPPLRDHREDIPALVDYFLTRFAARGEYRVRSVSPEAMALLAAYWWPGNVRELENVVERLVVAVRHETVGPDDLPLDVRQASGVATRPKHERRRTISDDLFKRLIEEKQSFWTAVYPLYMRREISRSNVRDLLRRGLEESRGSYRQVTRLFNMDPGDYKRVLNFLRKHECQVPYRDFR
jgi:transcriptional regulator with GAF, ATPase, and Fis domain